MLTFSINIFGQVGIGTQDPKATLHIEPSSVATPTGEDGILVPRLENFPTTDPVRLGQLIFLQDNGSLDDGFYYWDGTNWIPFPGSFEREIDDTLYSFDGQGYTGTGLTRNINFTKFVKASTDGFTLSGNEITVGKGGLYLVSFTGSSKRPTDPNPGEIQANFTYTILVNDVAASSVSTSITTEPTTSTCATFSFLRRLNAGDKLRATVTKSNEGSNNFQAFGINNLTLFFIQN